MPERIARMFTATVPVKIFPIPVATEQLHEILLWHKRNESDPAHAWFRELIVRLALDSNL
jgi:LysR family nod box-dependent transcriptional activator